MHIVKDSEQRHVCLCWGKVQYNYSQNECEQNCLKIIYTTWSSNFTYAKKLGMYMIKKNKLRRAWNVGAPGLSKRSIEGYGIYHCKDVTLWLLHRCTLDRMYSFYDRDSGQERQLCKPSMSLIAEEKERISELEILTIGHMPSGESAIKGSDNKAM